MFSQLSSRAKRRIRRIRQRISKWIKRFYEDQGEGSCSSLGLGKSSGFRSKPDGEQTLSRHRRSICYHLLSLVFKPGKSNLLTNYPPLRLPHLPNNQIADQSTHSSNSVELKPVIRSDQILAYREIIRPKQFHASCNSITSNMQKDGQ